MLKALRNRSIAKLWYGQALSSIGDEIYRVGLTWLAVGLIGANTGYLAAGQSAALMALSFVGGKWADRWDPLATMVRTDLLRSGIVLIPVAFSFFMPVPLWLLVIVALLLSALSAFFDPALQCSLPRFSEKLETLRAATGLMSTTVRLARMVGPAIVGFLAGLIPPIHFFTLDALSFAVSAYSVRSLKIEAPPDPIPRKIIKHISFTEAITAGFLSVRERSGMTYMMLSKALTSGTWTLAYNLGFALLVQQIAPNDTRSFGLLIAAYGMGNFAGALYFGNCQRRRAGLLMYFGYVWIGFGFALIALAPTLPWMMAAAVFTGFSGPMNELSFVDTVQDRFPIGDITRIFRLRMATETSVTLVLMLLSPFLFKLLSVRFVIGLCGLASIGIGLTGLIWEERKI